MENKRVEEGLDLIKASSPFRVSMSKDVISFGDNGLEGKSLDFGFHKETKALDIAFLRIKF